MPLQSQTIQGHVWVVHSDVCPGGASVAALKKAIQDAAVAPDEGATPKRASAIPSPLALRQEVSGGSSYDPGSSCGNNSCGNNSCGNNSCGNNSCGLVLELRLL